MHNHFSSADYADEKSRNHTTHNKTINSQNKTKLWKTRTSGEKSSTSSSPCSPPSPPPSASPPACSRKQQEQPPSVSAILDTHKQSEGAPSCTPSLLSSQPYSPKSVQRPRHPNQYSSPHFFGWVILPLVFPSPKLNSTSRFLVE